MGVGVGGGTGVGVGVGVGGGTGVGVGGVGVGVGVGGGAGVGGGTGVGVGVGVGTCASAAGQVPVNGPGSNGPVSGTTVMALGVSGASATDKPGSGAGPPAARRGVSCGPDAGSAVAVAGG